MNTTNCTKYTHPVIIVKMWSLKMKAQSLNPINTATLTISNIFYSNIWNFIWTIWDLVNLTGRKINCLNSSITFRYLFKSIYLNQIYNIIITKSNIWKYKMSLNLCIRIFRTHEYLWAICPIAPNVYGEFHTNQSDNCPFLTEYITFAKLKNQIIHSNEIRLLCWFLLNCFGVHILDLNASE